MKTCQQDRKNEKYQYVFSGIVAYRNTQSSMEQAIIKVLGSSARTFLLGINEAISNALEYSDENLEEVTVQVAVRWHGHWLIVRVKNLRGGFDWASKIASLHTRVFDRDDLGDLSERGRGMLVMQATSDLLQYNKSGDEVLLAKRLAVAKN